MFPHVVFFPERELRARLLKDEDGNFLLPDEDSDDERHSVGEVSSSRIMAADLPLLSLLTRDDLDLTDQSFLLVVDGVRLSGVVTIESLASVAARTALAAFVMELEFWSLELCHFFPSECLASLSEARQARVMQRFRDRLAHESKSVTASLKHRLPAALRRGNDFLSAFASTLLDVTYLADKGVMLRKCKLTLEPSASELKRLFQKAEKLRNWCVHPSESSLTQILSFNELRALLRTISQVIEVLKENVERETRARSKAGGEGRSPASAPTAGCSTRASSSRTCSRGRRLAT